MNREFKGFSESAGKTMLQKATQVSKKIDVSKKAFASFRFFHSTLGVAQRYLLVMDAAGRLFS